MTPEAKGRIAQLLDGWAKLPDAAGVQVKLGDLRSLWAKAFWLELMEEATEGDSQ